MRTCRAIAPIVAALALLQAVPVFALSCAEPSPGPASWWRGEDDARDEVGGRHGAALGGTSFGASRVGQGFVLDGSSGRVVIPAFPMAADWTLSGWVRPDSASDGAHSPVFARSTGNTSGLAVVYLGPAAGARARKFTMNLGDGGAWQVYLESADTFAEGQWHHVVAAKSGDAYTLYVDGTLQGALTVPGVADLYRRQPLVLGHWHYGVGESYTGGGIDDVAVFDRGLTAAEVAALALAGEAGICVRSCATVAPGPAAWWRADAGDASDEAGNNHGALVNGATTAPGRVGNAFSFDGVDDSVAVEVVTPNVALGKPVTPYTDSALGVPASVVDGDFESYWYSYQGDSNTVSLSIDLGRLANVGTVTFRPVQTAEYLIESSLDGTDWVTRHAGALADNTAPVIKVPVGGAYAARYFRYTGANHVNAYVGILEFQVTDAARDLGNFGTGDLSIALWMNLRTVRTNNFLVGRDTGPGTQDKWIFMYADGAFRFHVNGPATGDQYPVIVPYPVTTGNWYFVVLTRTGSLYTLSVNGVPIDAVTSTVSIPAIDAPLTIGEAEGLGYVDGEIDEPMVFTRALSAAEVSALHDAGWRGMCGPDCAPPPAGPVSWWRGEDATDAAGGNGGTLLNGATVAPARAGFGFALDGVDDHLQVAAPAGIPVGNAPRTFTAWIMSAGPTAGNLYQGIVGYGTATLGQPRSFFLERGANAEDGKFFHMNLSWGFVGATTIEYGRWYHVAATFDGTGMRLYLDGAEDGSREGALDTVMGPEGFMIGKSVAFDGWHQYFRGRIDEVAAFDRALSADEIAKIYAARASGMCAERTDLALAMSGAPASAKVGDRFTHALTATNSGPGVAAGVRLVVALPAEVELVAATPSAGGSCSSSGRTVTCTLGTLGPAGSRGAEIEVRTLGAAIGATATATATSLNFETNHANNSASESLDILDPQGTLVAATTGDFGAVQVGATSAALEFTLSSTGVDALGVTAVRIDPAGANAGEYEVAGIGGAAACTLSGPFALPPGDACTVSVRFAPAAAGARSDAALAAETDAGTLTAALAGTGRSTLTASVPRPQSGTVTGAGIDCGADCTQDYTAADSSVELTASAAAGWTFLRWDGDVSSVSNPVTIAVPTNTAVHPVFATTVAVCPTCPADRNTVQKGIDAAGQGDVVEIAAGLYRENVVIAGDRELTLRGPGSPLGNPSAVPPTAAAIDGDTDGDGLPDGPAVRVQAGAGERVGLTLERLALRRGAGGLVVETAAGGTADVTLRRALLTGNSGGTTGGGISVVSAGETRLRVDNALIQGNEAEDGAGIMAVATGSGDVQLAVGDSTISGNRAAYSGAGVYLSGKANATVESSILWGNTAEGAARDVDTVSTLWEATLLADHTDLGARTGTVTTYGCINADPVFVNPALGDYHLQRDSPCVDTGALVADAGGEDIDGDARPDAAAGLYDMGADERVDAPVAKVVLLGPKGGEQVLGGEPVDVTWAAPATAVRFAVFASSNNGVTWKKLADVTEPGARHWAWTLPAVSKNVSYRVKVVQQTAAGRSVASAVGAKFTVGALRIVTPKGTERVRDSLPYRVQWLTAPGKAATNGKLYLSTDGGATWKLQSAVVPPVGAFVWTVPTVTATKTKCRVRLDLYNGLVKVGSDTSDANFTIVP